MCMHFLKFIPRYRSKYLRSRHSLVTYTSIKGGIILFINLKCILFVLQCTLNLQGFFSFFFICIIATATSENQERINTSTIFKSCDCNLTYVSPVCGRNGQTYDNRCRATCRSVDEGNT